MKAHAPIKIEVAPHAAVTAHDLGSEQMLAVISYDGLVLAQPRCPLVTVPLSQLGKTPYLELWSCTTSVERGRFGNVDYATNGEVSFGVCQREEATGALLDDITYEVYRDVIRAADAKGCPQLLRMWNYFGDINGIQQGEQRYHRFCTGRHRALEEFKPGFERALPAASVIGTREPGITVYFLATRELGVAVENPRQLSAYRYPAQYGPQSPSFSRAMLKAWPHAVHLYVSGTASIVGHSTVHNGDVRGQLQEILRNLQALLTKASRSTCAQFPGIFEASALKVYVRRPDDLPVIEDALTQALGRRLSVLYLQGDPCRSDLLVEIEGVYAH